MWKTRWPSKPGIKQRYRQDREGSKVKLTSFRNKMTKKQKVMNPELAVHYHNKTLPI